MAGSGQARRPRLNRHLVLTEAVAFADANGIAALSMRRLAQQLGVAPMALYKHVTSKDDLLDGMLALLLEDVRETPSTGEWREDVRRRILATRSALIEHPWSQEVLSSRPQMTAAMLDHLDGLVGAMLQGGLPVDLTHHTMHVLGNRMWGFNPELFAATPASDPSFEVQRSALPLRHRHLAEIAAGVDHGAIGVETSRMHDDFEFNFALNLILDGIEEYRNAD